MIRGRAGAIRLWTILLCGVLVVANAARGESPGPQNLALAARGGQCKSWEPGVPVVPEHEPAKANDGSFHSYWAVDAEHLPADLGVEWPQPQQVSSVVVRYFDGRMVRGPAIGRTQQWAQLQYWNQGAWKTLDAQMAGQETSAVRYSFPPVTTTRLRLLFTEPPDPELRRFPDRLGIYVCEFEAYRDVPYKLVNSPDRVARVQEYSDRTYLKNFNEPPMGDSNYDVTGPLVIEPKVTGVVADTLTPTLVVAESRWAREPCAMDQSQPHAISFRNGFLQLDLAVASSLKETRLINRVTGESVPTPHSSAFLIRTSQGDFTPEDLKVSKVDTMGSGADVNQVRIELTSQKLDVAVHYELRRQDHFYHKWLTVTNRGEGDIVVRDVVLSSLHLPHLLDLMAGTELTYPVSRLKEGGFFSCIETVYWDHRLDELTYYPGVTLAAGKSCDTELATVGVYKNRGEQWMGWDRGVREWVIEYHDQISPTPPTWPDVYCEAWSAGFGVKDVLQNAEAAERFMANAEKLGIRYMDAYEATHDALIMPSAWVKAWVDLATRHNIGAGFWTDFGSDDDFGTGTLLRPMECKLSPESQAYFERMVGLVKTYKLRCMHWGDFLCVWQCNKEGHGHLAGKYSIYAQGKRVVQFNHDMHEVSPGLMVGADGGFTNPQYVRFEDSRGHGTYYGGYAGDHFPVVEPDIHLDRLYADMNRVWLTGSHAVYLRPWYRTINPVDHYGQETHTNDAAGFRYGLLSALAMAGQVTFNDVPDNIPEDEFQFAQHWLAWARGNKDYLKQGDRLFYRSQHFADVWQGDADGLAGFAHLRGDRGYVFLINPTPVEQVAALKLALDAPASAHFDVQELYPGGLTLQGPEGGRYAQGGELRVTVPAKQVRVLWIAPASGSTETNLQPEDARVASWRRYQGDWDITKQTADSVTVKAQFNLPASAQTCLTDSTPEADWAGEPWGYKKAYLILYLKDETLDLNNNWVPDNLPAGLHSHNARHERTFTVNGKPSMIEDSSGSPGLSVTINGVSKTVHAFKTKRVQEPGVTRCYFVDLAGETRASQANSVEVTLPIRTGLVFSGVYVDLPDQVPLGRM